jgi:RHS repeat-associated protein
VLEERDGTGGLVAAYTYGHDLLSMRRDGAARFYHHDAHSGTRALTDTAGALTDSYVYDAFGLPTAATGVTANSYRYAGEQFEPALNQYYLRARYYDPSIGRFTARDPHPGSPRDPLSLQPYLYAHASPCNATDPSGRFTVLEASVSVSIQDVLRGLEYVKNATGLCKIKALEQELSIVAAVGSMASVFFFHDDRDTLKPGFEFVWIPPGKKSQMKKMALRIYVQGTDRIAQIAVDRQDNFSALQPVTQTRFEFNIDNPAASAIGGGLSRKLLTIEMCGIEIAKLDGVVRGMATAGGVLKAAAGLDATFFALAKLSVKLWGSPDVELPSI